MPLLPARMLLRLLGLTLVLLSACRDAPAPGDAASAPARPEAFTDALGRTVEAPRPAGRVVTLAPSLTEMVYAAGGGARLVGVTTADDYPPAVDTLARFSALPLNVEAVALLRPDLALATTQVNAPRDADALEALGIPTAFFSSTSLDDVLGGIRTLGTLLGTRAAADRTADSLRTRIERLRARTAAAAGGPPGDPPRDPPRVLFLIGDDRLFAFGRDAYVHDLIALAGGESVTADLDTAAPVLSDEYVIDEAPDVIVGAFGEDYDPADLLARHPTWASVPAVREGRVYGVDPALFLRPGPRLVAGAERLAELLDPAAAP